MYMLDGQTLQWMHKQSKENSVQWKALQVDSAEDRTCKEMQASSRMYAVTVCYDSAPSTLCMHLRRPLPSSVPYAYTKLTQEPRSLAIVRRSPGLYNPKFNCRKAHEQRQAARMYIVINHPNPAVRGEAERDFKLHGQTISVTRINELASILPRAHRSPEISRQNMWYQVNP